MLDKQVILLAIIAGLPGFLISAVSLYIAIKKNPHEIEQADANSESARAEAVESYANATATYAQEVKALREEVRQLRTNLDNREKIIKELRIQLDDLKDWAIRLVHQVQSLGADPVPFRQTTNKGDTS